MSESWIFAGCEWTKPPDVRLGIGSGEGVVPASDLLGGLKSVLAIAGVTLQVGTFPPVVPLCFVLT